MPGQRANRTCAGVVIRTSQGREIETATLIEHFAGLMADRLVKVLGVGGFDICPFRGSTFVGATAGSLTI